MSFKTAGGLKRELTEEAGASVRRKLAATERASRVKVIPAEQPGNYAKVTKM